MNTHILRCAFVVLALVAAILPARAQVFCSTPSTLGITNTWGPASAVGIVPHPAILSQTSAASLNYNVAFGFWVNPIVAPYGVCFQPTFSVGTAVLAKTLWMDYGPIPPTPDCQLPNCNIRGQVSLGGATRVAGRLTSVNGIINSLVTDATVIGEVIAHEMGHTLGLADCPYPACALHNSVMISGAPVGINGSEGRSGPTVCDVDQIMATANDYTCPPPPPPPVPPDPPPVPVCALPVTVGTVVVCCDITSRLYDAVVCASPILIDLTGDGFFLTDAANGVTFDISGTGTPIKMGWTSATAANAFLALPGADGRVTNGKQLFGNFTPQPASPNPNGFEALAVYDQPANGGNGDGVIDVHDRIFASLRLWIDANHDGIAQPDELFTLPSKGVYSISLHYHLSSHMDRFGNSFRFWSKVNPTGAADDSNVGPKAFDVFFVSAPK